MKELKDGDEIRIRIVSDKQMIACKECALYDYDMDDCHHLCTKLHGNAHFEIVEE